MTHGPFFLHSTVLIEVVFTQVQDDASHMGENTP